MCFNQVFSTHQRTISLFIGVQYGVGISTLSPGLVCVDRCVQVVG